ncbi:YoaK family protein [Lapidilactobacillus salsurivasis]
MSKECDPMHEHLLIGFLLTMAGGALDAYSYLNHGQVFAGLQTGNVILLTLHLAQGHLEMLGRYLFPLLAFFIGVFATVSIEHHFDKNDRFLWQHIVLIVEIVGLIIVAFVSPHLKNIWVTCLISLIASIQYQTFRKVRGRPFATTMTTGNLRNTAVFLWLALLKKEPENLRKALETLLIVVAFMLGAVISGLLTPIYHNATVLFISADLACVLAILLIMQRHGQEEAI